MIIQNMYIEEYFFSILNNSSSKTSLIKYPYNYCPYEKTSAFLVIND